MWVVSRFPGLTVKLRNEEPVFSPSGQIIKRQPKLKVEFRPGYFPAWAHEQAKQRWPEPPGAPDSMLVPANLYGGLETRSQAIEKNWSDEDLKFVEEQMSNWRPRAGTDWFVAEPVKLTAPWPGYNGTTGKQGKVGDPSVSVEAVIVDLVVQTGSDPAYVIAYEKQEFNDGAGRPEVVDALERLLVGDDADEREELILA